MAIEKSMYFIPNRFYTNGSEMFVSFNIAVIPVDMIVTDMQLHVPHRAGSTAATLLARTIASGWDESIMAGGYVPLIGDTVMQLFSPIGSVETVLPLTTFADAWRFDSLHNHGITIHSTTAAFTSEQLPFLLIKTV